MTQATSAVPTPSERRRTREALQVSRATVQKATGLTGSVIWRSEQEDRQVTEEQRDQLDELYRTWARDGVPAEYARPEPKPKASTGGVHPATRARELTARLNDVAALLAEAATAKTLRETKAAIDRAREVLTAPAPTPVVASAPAPAAGDETAAETAAEAEAS
jgi:hypothetical protein